MPNPSVKLFLSCVSDEFGDYRDALRQRADAAERRGQDPGGFQGARRRHAAACSRTISSSARRSSISSARWRARRRRRAASTTCSRVAPISKRGSPTKGIAREALETPHLHAMGGVARHRLRQGPADRRAGRGRRRAARTSRRPTLRAPSQARASRAAAGDQPLSRPAVHERRQSRRADFRIGGHRRAGEGRQARPPRQPRNLPFASLGDLFKGREKALEDLRAALASAKGAAVVGRALHGLGGVGKTRLAIEYALGARGRLFGAPVRARRRSRRRLNASLAALAGAVGSRPAGEGGARGRGEDRGRRCGGSRPIRPGS